MAKILEGVRVLDFSRVAAAPLCTLLLADFGAEVIKVEAPGVGDDSRTLPPLLGKWPYHFTQWNRGKKSVTLDLRKPEARKIALDIAKKSDVIVENFKPGMMKAWGLSYDDVKAVNPRAVYASLSGFGQTGPYSPMMAWGLSYDDVKAVNPRAVYASLSGFGQTGPYSPMMAYDFAVVAMGGLTGMNGEPDKPPMPLPFSVADFHSPLYLTIAILAAIMQQRQTGQGQWIDISMHDTVWYLVGSFAIPKYFAENVVIERTGGENEMAGRGVFKAKDDYIYIGCVSNRQWQTMLKLVGGDELANDPDWAGRKGRRKHRQDADALIDVWLSDKTAEEAMQILLKNRVASGIVKSVDQLLHDTHIAARGMIKEVDQPGVGKLKVIGSPFQHMSGMQYDFNKPAPELGQHNRDVYASILGFDDAKLAQLREQGVI